MCCEAAFSVNNLDLEFKLKSTGEARESRVTDQIKDTQSFSPLDDFLFDESTKEVAGGHFTFDSFLATWTSDYLIHDP